MLITVAVDKKRLEEALNHDKSNNASENYFYIPLGSLFVRLLVHTRVTPNQLTIFWGCLMFFSSLCFWTDDRWINVLGGIGWVISYALDCADGSLARYTNLKSGRGDYLDGFNHRLTYPLLMFSLGYWAYMWGMDSIFGFDFDPAVYLFLGCIAGACMVLIIDVGNIYNRIMPDNQLVTNAGTTGMEGEYVKHKSFYKKVVPFSPFPFTNMLFLIPFFALFGYLDVFIVFYAFVYAGGLFYRAHLLYKKIPGPDMSGRFR